MPPRKGRRRSDREIRRSLVFISHDSRDHALAEAFANLLSDASGGILKTFRSSDKRGFSGIAFGAEWYATVMAQLTEATDVVALVTKNSLNRPWILYEVGVARGRSGVPAFGLAFGLPLEKVEGPFAQLQNSSDDEDSITKLVLQLIRRIPEASPREEAVRLQVASFRKSVARLRPATTTESSQAQSGSSVLFEEVKAMFGVIADQMAQLNRRWPRERRRMEEDELSVPAWVEEAQAMLHLLKISDGRKRNDAWRKIVTLTRAWTAISPSGLETVGASLRTRDVKAMEAGLGELRQYLHEEGSKTPRDENDGYAFDLLLELADVVEAWLPGEAPPRTT